MACSTSPFFALAQIRKVRFARDKHTDRYYHLTENVRRPLRVNRYRNGTSALRPLSA
jgi:hypothetical protein